MTHDEMISVIQAHKEGKEIEVTLHNDVSNTWVACTNPRWHFDRANYRIKPEPPLIKSLYIGNSVDATNVFHTSGCFSNYENTPYFPLSEKFFKSDRATYMIRGKIVAEIDPYTYELISVKVVK